jgi:hypothetical protein
MSSMSPMTTWSPAAYAADNAIKQSAQSAMADLSMILTPDSY